MIRLFISLVLLFGSQFLRAQSEGTSWKITLNKKVVLKGSGETADSSVLTLKKADLSNNGTFKIEYDTKNEPRGWARTIAIFDTAEASIAQRDSTSAFFVYNKDLLKILWSRKRVYVYSWSAPIDKGMAAAIRIRRLKLCTLELID